MLSSKAIYRFWEYIFPGTDKAHESNIIRKLLLPNEDLNLDTLHILPRLICHSEVIIMGLFYKEDDESDGLNCSDDKRVIY